MDAGDVVQLKKYKSVYGFTANKQYLVEAGAGDFNLSPVAKKAGMLRLSNMSFNIVDDFGMIRTCQITDFRGVE